MAGSGSVRAMQRLVVALCGGRGALVLMGSRGLVAIAVEDAASVNRTPHVMSHPDATFH
jgi:hypothetical protein